MWARCPACGCVTWDAARHAARERALARALASLALPVTEATPDDYWPDDVPVPTPGDIPDVDAARAVTLRGKADAARQAITTSALPALDAYLALATPTTAQALAQVRTLTTIVRGLALAVRALIRLTTRTLDSTDTEA